MEHGADLIGNELAFGGFVHGEPHLGTQSFEGNGRPTRGENVMEGFER
jgi:hypothetical protein